HSKYQQDPQIGRHHERKPKRQDREQIDDAQRAGHELPPRLAIARTPVRRVLGMVKATSDNTSIAWKSGPYCASNAGTESSVMAMRLVTISRTIRRLTMSPVRSPIGPCSRIS